MSRLGIKPTAFWCIGQFSKQLSHTDHGKCLMLFKTSFFICKMSRVKVLLPKANRKYKYNLLTLVQENAARLLLREGQGAACQAGAMVLPSPSPFLLPRSLACLLPLPICHHPLLHVGSVPLPPFSSPTLRLQNKVSVTFSRIFFKS